MRPQTHTRVLLAHHDAILTHLSDYTTAQASTPAAAHTERHFCRSESVFVTE